MKGIKTVKLPFHALFTQLKNKYKSNTPQNVHIMQNIIHFSFIVNTMTNFIRKNISILYKSLEIFSKISERL